MSKNYPDTTFEGDPTAPWNDGDAISCENCALMYEIFDTMVCTHKIDPRKCTDAAEVIAEVEASQVFSFEWCQNWEKA